jgi:hypothetical protein
MTSDHLSLSSDELDLLKSDELSTELKSYIPFTKKVCIFSPPPSFPSIQIPRLGLPLPPGGGGGGGGGLVQQIFRFRLLFLNYCFFWSRANNFYRIALCGRARGPAVTVGLRGDLVPSPPQRRRLRRHRNGEAGTGSPRRCSCYEAAGNGKGGSLLGLGLRVGTGWSPAARGGGWRTGSLRPGVDQRDLNNPRGVGYPSRGRKYCGRFSLWGRRVWDFC